LQTACPGCGWVVRDIVQGMTKHTFNLSPIPLTRGMEVPELTLPPPYDCHTPKRPPSPEPGDLGPARQTSPMSPMPSERRVILLQSDRLPVQRSRSAPPAKHAKHHRALSVEPLNPRPYLPRLLLGEKVDPPPESPTFALSKGASPCISSTGPSAISELNQRVPIESIVGILIPAVEHQTMSIKLQHCINELRGTHSRDDHRDESAENSTKAADASRRALHNEMRRYHQVIRGVWIDIPPVPDNTGSTDAKGVMEMFHVTYYWVLGLLTSLKTAYQAGGLEGWDDGEYLLLLLAEIRPSRLILCVWKQYRPDVAQWLAQTI
jgi:hypothetical protein